MPTSEFLKEWEYYKGKNRILKTYEEKQEVWQHCKIDYGFGYRAYEPSCDDMERFHRSLARFKVLNTPNRYGKTMGTIYDLLPGIVDPKGDCHGWIVAENYSIGLNEWRFLEDAIAGTDLYDEIIHDLEKQCKERNWPSRNCRKLIKFTTSPANKLTIKWPCARDTIVEIKSYNNSSSWMRLEGTRLSFWLFAEGSQVPLNLWDYHLKKRGDDLAAVCYVPATPKGEDEFMHPMYLKGLDRKLIVNIDYENKSVTAVEEAVRKHPHQIDKAVSFVDSYESFHFDGRKNPLWGSARGYKSDEEALFRGELDEAVFRERNFGEYVSKTGKFFDNMPESAFVQSDKRPIHPEAMTVRGVDIGTASNSCCLWASIEPPLPDGREIMIIKNELYKPISYAGSTPDGDGLADQILEITGTEEIFDTVVDRVSASRNSPNSHRTIEEILRDDGIPCTTNGSGSMPKKTIERLYKIKSMILRGLIIIYEDKCPNLCRELRTLEYKDPKYEKGKTIQGEELAKQNMDATDSLTYIVFKNYYWQKPSWKKKQERKEVEPQKHSMRWFLERNNQKIIHTRKRSIFSGIG